MKKILLLILIIAFTAFISNAQRKKYSGSHHTTSHGGTYKSGSDASHKSGKYKLSSTNNHYGQHKK
jgi:hypothetical protein